MKIALTGGGTAGHVTPHLALLPKLKENFDKIIYIGSKTGIEKEIIQKEHIKYYSTETTKLVRNKPLSALAIPFKLAKGIKEAKKILRQEKPDVIFSKGGFVSLPTVIAGSKLKIPILIHESDLTCGLANKIASRYAQKVCTTFEKTSKEFKQKGLYTGSPMRKTSSSFLNPFANSKPIITVTGGSQGAKAINTAIRENLDILLKKYNIYHICGKGNLSGIKKTGYKEVEYTDQILAIFKNSCMAISRAGSNTIFELKALNIPMLLIPLPKGNSRGDQEDNAKYFCECGFATMLKQNEVTTKTLLAKIEETEINSTKMKQAMKKATTPDSINIITSELVQMAKSNT